MKQTRFITKRSLSFLIIAFTCLCALVFNLIYEKAKESAVNRLNDEQMIHAKQAARGIEESIATWTGILTSLSRMSEVATVDEAGKRQMELFYDAHYEQIRSFTRMDENGTILFTVPDRGTIGRNLTPQKHVQELLKTRKPVISDVFRTVQGFDAVALHVPVFQGAQFKGSIALTINFQSLARRYLEIIKIGRTGYAWVVSRDGTELYCPVPGHTGNSVFANCKDFPSIIAMATDMLKGHSGITTYTFDKISGTKVTPVVKHAVYFPIKLGNTFWSIVVASSEQEVLSSLSSYRNRLLLVMGMVLIGGIILAWLGIKALLIVKEENIRMQAEDSLRESEDRFRHVSSLISDIAYSCTIDGSGRYAVNWMTGAAERICGYSIEELKARRCWQFLVAEEDLAIFAENVTGLTPGSHGSCELRIRHKNGSMVWLSSHAECVKKPGPRDGHVLYGGLVDITARKWAESALRESEVKHRRLYETMAQGVVYQDANGSIITANPSAERILGLPLCQIRGKTSMDCSWKSIREDGSDLPGDEHPSMVALRTGQPAGPRVLGVFNPEKNEHSWLSVTAIPLFQPGESAPAQVYATFEDITEQRKAERNYRTLFRKMLDGFALHEIICDEHGIPVDYRFLEINPAFERMTGLKAEESLGKTVRDLMPGIETHWIVTYGRVALTGEPVFFESYTKELDKHFQVTAFRPAPNQFACIFTDVTEHRRAEEALRESEVRYRELVENANSIILRMDKMGTVTFMNEFAQQFFGYHVDEIVGRSVMGTIVPESDSSGRDLRAMIHDIGLHPERYVANENENMKRDGTRVWISWTNKPMTDSSGMVNEILCVGNDATARKLAEEEREKLQVQLNQAQRIESVGRLAGGVAHDFNNMLGVILGHAEMALLKLNPEHPHYHDLQAIHAAAERSADLTRQLLAFARRQTITPTVVDLNATIEGMLKMLRRLIGEDIDLAWKPGSGLWPLKMDPSQLDQILANLCVNARDAIEGVGKVTIETTNALFDESYCRQNAEVLIGEYVLLAVSDDGCGMEKETLVQIFDPFFTTKELGQGTGLGLATVYGIVKQNNGFINVYSEPGEGTTFKIYLPRHTAGSEIAKAAPPEPVGRGHETILLVEDEPAILKIGKEMLENFGYTVQAAGTPGEAIRIAEEHAGDINLLMTDVIMPEMNGRELARRLLSLYPELACLFMSGYTADVIAHRGVLEEGVHFIQKPFSVNGLAAKVREALDAR
jgi:PAS domain S-box-containing protein